MANINRHAAKPVRLIKEDGTIVNIADLLSASQSMEQYGTTVAERPAANTVRVGTIYIAVNTQEAWMSNGTSWVVI